jgi:uncharacterized membrane protein YqgA involved in biofilm formation
MIGTLLNGVAIVAGGIAGLTVTKQLSPLTQRRLKVFLGAFTVYVGLRMTWGGLNGTFGQVLKQFAIVLVALILGRLTGRLLRIQHGLNRLGRYARESFSAAQSATDHRFSDGFVTCTVLFCVGPLAILGSLEDGLHGDFKTLAIKAVMDGLATVAFAQTFGWGVILAAVPVVAYQGTLTLAARALAPRLETLALLDPVCATGGIMLFSVALVILELKKVELADYLPSLVCAPLLTWLLR